MVDHAKKLDFIHKMSKLGLQHFDSGGMTQNTATNPNSGLAGSFNSFLGLNNNFQAGAANIQAGTNQDQLGQAYGQAQNSLGQEQQLANTLQPQAEQAVAQQQQLAQNLQAQANGQGPNVAQNQLNQATGQNIASQAALMAGQRGSGSNVGLMARQIGQQGAGIEQNAAGQAATLGAQQQIAAQQALGNLSANQVSQAGQAVNNLASANQSEQGILQNANTSFNNAGVGMQSNMNNVNAQTSASNQNMAGNTIGGVASGIASAVFPGLHFAEGGEVTSDEGKFETTNSPASSGPQISATPQLPSSSKQGGGGNPLQSLASVASIASMFAANGGMAEHHANGGISGNPLLQSQNPWNNQSSFIGSWHNVSQASSGPNIGGAIQLPSSGSNMKDSIKEGAAIGNAVRNEWDKSQSDKPGEVGSIESSYDQGLNTGMGDYGTSALSDNPSMGDYGAGLSNSAPGSSDYSGGNWGPGSVSLEACGGKIKAPVKNMSQGGGPVIPDNNQEQAVASGNNYANDKIPAMLSANEIVIPRNITMHPNAPALAAEFVRRTLAKKGLKRGLA